VGVVAPVDFGERYRLERTAGKVVKARLRRAATVQSWMPRMCAQPLAVSVDSAGPGGDR